MKFAAVANVRTHHNKWYSLADPMTVPLAGAAACVAAAAAVVLGNICCALVTPPAPLGVPLGSLLEETAQA
jgi:hypothetical protein